MPKTPVIRSPIPLRVGLRFVGVDQGDRTLVIRNPALVGTAPAQGLIAFFGRLARPFFGEEARLAAARGERIFPVTAVYADTTDEQYRIGFERSDFPARRWLDLRHMRLSLAEGILPLLGLSKRHIAGSAGRLNLDMPAVVRAFRPTHIARALPALEDWLGTSLDMIVFPGTIQTLHVSAQGQHNPPATAPVYAWVIRPESLIEIRAEDADRHVRPLEVRR